MKKLIARPLSWILYHIGDKAEKLINDWEWTGTVFYPIYNKCILASSDLDVWAGLAPPWNVADLLQYIKAGKEVFVDDVKFQDPTRFRLENLQRANKCQVDDWIVKDRETGSMHRVTKQRSDCGS